MMKEAGVLLPRWAVGAALNVLLLGMYLAATHYIEPKPPALLATATTVAIVLSLLLGVGLLISEILKATEGHYGAALHKGLQLGFSTSWTCIAVAFVTYIGYVPVTSFVTENWMMVLIIGGAVAVVGVGYFFARPSSSESGEVASAAQAGTNQLVATGMIQPTPLQRPVFQATIADLTRLLAHQAGRTIGYTGSNILFDDNFSLELDINARVARVYSNTNLVNTSDFMYWRLHMLLMGPAAEKALLGSSSEVAVDDMTSFDELAGRYLTLQNDRTFSAKPINQYEAGIKAARITLLRKTVFDRCYAACKANREILVDLVKLMRTRSVLTHGDIKHLLARVTMEESFPVARFEETDILTRALLAYDDHEEVTIEDYLDHSKAETEQTASAATKASDANHQPAESTGPRPESAVASMTA